MLHNNEKPLLFTIRYMPLIFIVFLSVLVTSVIELSNKKLMEENIIETKKRYVKFHNDEIKEEVEKIYKYIEDEQKNSINELKKYIKQRVYEAHAIAVKIYEDNKKKKTDDEILNLIKTALGSIIYNKGRGYFFIDSIEGVSLLQPLNKQLENKNKLEFTDAKGYQFVKTIVKTIKEKSERYDTYYWYKGGDRVNAYEKISFYKYFEPLNFIIGTGDYVDDFIKEMKQKILNYISNIKLSDNGYIFIINYNGDMLAHNKKSMIGNNYIDLEDINGLTFIKKIIDTAKDKNSNGFVSYYFSAFDEKAYKKTSYVKSFDEWEWVIGTGYYDKDLNEIIKKETKRFKNKYEQEYSIILIISIFSTFLLLILSFFLSNLLEKRFNSYKDRIEMEEMEFKNLFETSEVGLAINDKDGKFIKVNKKFARMLAYKSSEELYDKYWNDIILGSFNEDEQKLFNELKNEKIEKLNLEKDYKRADGTVFDGYLSATAFYIDSEFKYILSSLIDISEVKEKDNILFQQSKMAAMGEMLANIAHQWRQPLSAISTASSGLKIQNAVGVINKEDLDSSLDLIKNTSLYLSNTIEDFRNFFNPENKEKIEIEVDTLITQALNLLSAQFKNKKIKVIKDIENINLKILRNELIQVILNLLNNSRDALTQIDSIEKKLIFIKVKKEDKYAVISIKDNAGGIDEKIINRVFEPYFTTKHKAQGTGIGLYMVDEIVKKHMNGEIKVENLEFLYEGKVYKGVEFKLYISIES